MSVYLNVYSLIPQDNDAGGEVTQDSEHQEHPGTIHLFIAGS